MWHALSLHLSELLDIDFEIREKTAISGGDIHDAYCISDRGEQRFFVKINQRECLPTFEAEAAGLRQLAMSEHIHVPRVYFVGPVKDSAALVLNFLPIKSLNDTHAYLFGQQLASKLNTVLMTTILSAPTNKEMAGTANGVTSLPSNGLAGSCNWQQKNHCIWATLIPSFMASKHNWLIIAPNLPSSMAICGQATSVYRSTAPCYLIRPAIGAIAKPISP